ncbi:hypothetical protein ASPFODRAFT_712036 [Aspergillus luchuensis CBS 106.47]|uniref:Uncharacterized protein n=1 Tax=Aspergillus luchuensis (strain CBS 106.47) TaxID=1137211 RepID=A0A1M3SZI5_ASPLC|nr:hypothetical protein ASPFODRAFT_712036 [Aspergillus luchuensis CBS 106.47]
MAESENERPSAGPIRTAVETEIRAMENYMNWRCRAVTGPKKNPTGSELLVEMRLNTSRLRRWQKPRSA